MDEEKILKDEEVSFESMMGDYDFEDGNEKVVNAKAKSKIIDACSNLKNKAEALLKDDNKMENFFIKVEDTLNKIPIEKIPKVGPMLKEEFPLGDIGVMLSLCRSFVLKKYTNVAKNNIIIALVCLLYLVNPFDIIPDYIPILGWLDDAFVATVIAKVLEEELEKYKDWRINQKDFVEVDFEREEN